jgi:hypothetical protein
MNTKLETVQVTKDWLKSLLDLQAEFEAAMSKYDYHNVNNNKIMIKASALSGYARSAKYIINRLHNDN